MYGTKTYRLELATTEYKGNKSVKTEYDTHCELGGYGELYEVEKFGKACKKLYRTAVSALSKGCRIDMQLSVLIYDGVDSESHKIKLFQEWQFIGDIYTLGLSQGEKVYTINLKPHISSDNYKEMMEIFLTVDTFHDIAINTII